MFSIQQYFLIFISLLLYGNLETCLKITGSGGNMGKYGLFLGFYYKRNAIYLGIGLSIIAWCCHSNILLALGLLVFGFFSLQMLKQIYEYKNLFEE
jgi:hypothetical protein